MSSHPRSDRFPSLDGLRALAAFAVIGTHVGFNSGRTLQPGLLGPILARLDIGVAIFFLLSGFLLYRPFALHAAGAGRRPGLRTFFWRRGLRIFPALWVFVLIALSLLTVYVVHPIDYLQYLLLIQTYDHHDYDPNLTHLWTLAVEISFYCLVPVFGRLLGRPERGAAAAVRRQLLGCLGLVVIAVVFNIGQGVLNLPQSQALLWLPGYLDWFAVGIALAVLSAWPARVAGVRGAGLLTRLAAVARDCASAPGTCWLIAALIFMLATLPVGVPYNLAPATWWQWSTQHWLFAVAALFIMLPLVLGEHAVIGRVLGGPVAHELANLSYSVYLWHVPVMLLVQRQLGFASFQGHFWVMLGITTLLTLGVAALSWYGLEQPILRYGSRRLARRGPRADSTPFTTAARHAS